MTSWFIYWMIIIGRLHVFFGGAAILFTVVIIIWEITMIIYYSDDADKKHATQKMLLPVKFSFLIPLFTLLSIFTPKLEEIAAIYLIPKLVNNESVQEIPEKALDLLEAQLDKWIAGIKDEE